LREGTRGAQTRTIEGRVAVASPPVIVVSSQHRGSEVSHVLRLRETSDNRMDAPGTNQPHPPESWRRKNSNKPTEHKRRRQHLVSQGSIAVGFARLNCLPRWLTRSEIRFGGWSSNRELDRLNCTPDRDDVEAIRVSRQDGDVEENDAGRAFHHAPR